MTISLPDQSRLLALIIGCAVLWTVESLAPLYVYERQRLRRALPNIALTVILVLTNLALSFGMVAVTVFVAKNNFGLFALLKPSNWLLAILGVAALDLFSYIAHVLLHKSWVGWQFHRVHHSDNEVNVTTAFRQHPGETVWRILWYMLAISVFGIPIWVFVIYRTASTLNAQLEHTNIKLPESFDRAVRLLFVTPNMHKIHHSREQIQTDTNYANVFSVWDRVFGTYTRMIDFQALRYGLDGFDDARRQTLPALLVLPFQVKS